MADGEEDFVAVDDDASMPPIPFKAADVAEIRPHWEPIARSLAEALGFDHGAWENSGSLRRIGSTQDPFGRVTPVLLFLPAGHLGDFNGLFRELSTQTESTVLFPTHRWFTAEMEALRIRNRLEFIDLADRIAQIAAHPATRVPLPVIAKPRPAGQPKVRAVIHAGNGLTWSQITIELAGNQTIRLTAPGQDGSHSFPKRQQLGPEHPLGILMTLAAKGEWRNPPFPRPITTAFPRPSSAGKRCSAFSFRCPESHFNNPPVPSSRSSRSESTRSWWHPAPGRPQKAPLPIRLAGHGGFRIRRDQI